MKEYGFTYSFYYPLTITGFDPPIAVFSIYMNEQAENEYLDTKSKREAFSRFAYEQAKRVELIFNAQYLRSKDRDNNE